MSWNYRLFREPDGSYAIYECYYGDDKKLIGWTERPSTVGTLTGKTKKEVRTHIERFLRATKLPTLKRADLERAADKRRKKR